MWVSAVRLNNCNRYEVYSVAMNINYDEKQKEQLVFLHCKGAKVQGIFYCYKEDSAEDFDFESQKLKKYFIKSRKHYSFKYCGRISSVSRAPD